MDSLRGHLLVATPAIEDGVFARSVVYLLDHDEDGALGVIVNRPLTADITGLLPDWFALATSPGCLFRGGPVGPEQAIAVGVLADPQPAAGLPRGWRGMSGRIGLVDLDEPLPDEGQLAGLRVFAGYAGWSPLQLESEVDEGAWLVVEAELDDVVSQNPEALWRDVLRRQQSDLRLWSTFPPDPHVN